MWRELAFRDQNEGESRSITLPVNKNKIAINTGYSGINTSC